MAINLASLALLSELSARWRPEGRSLSLGRQTFPAAGLRGPWWSGRAPAAAALKAGRPDLRIEECVQADGYAETLFRTLGFGEVEALDYAPHEGASIAWDLNVPTPESLDGQFGFIFDGGTLEHVFDVPTAFDSVYRMLRVGGVFVGMNPLNGWLAHGMYQFDPGLIWSYWDDPGATTIRACVAVDRAAGFRRDLPNPSGAAGRQKWKVKPLGRGDFPTTRLLMWYEVEKTGERPKSRVRHQKHFQHHWDRARQPAADAQREATP